MASSQRQDTDPLHAYTVVGTPYSTYTRAITLALTYKHVAFDQVRAVPHSDTAYAHHPFGFLPTLIVRTGDGGAPGTEWKLCESQAIARYIDRVHPEPSLVLAHDAGVLPERVWEFVSLAGAYGLPAVEKGVVKPFVATIDAASSPASPAAIVAAAAAAAAPGLAALERFLAHVEARMVPAPLDAYAFGADPTWADFFLYPLLSDLRAIEAQVRDGGVLSARLSAWMGRMDALEAVQRTREGTLESGARPP